MKCGVDTVIIGDSIKADPACYTSTWNKFFLKKLNFRIGQCQTKYILQRFKALAPQINIKTAIISYGVTILVKTVPLKWQMECCAKHRS